MGEDTPVKVESTPQSPDLGEQLKKLKVATDSLDRGKAYEDDLGELKASVSELPSETRVEMVRKFISGELTDKSNGLDKYALGQVFRVLVDTDKEAVVNLFIDELKDVKGYSYEKFFNLGIIANSGLDMQMVFEGLTESESDGVQKAIDGYNRPDDEAIESSVRLLYGLEGSLYHASDHAVKILADSPLDSERLRMFVEKGLKFDPTDNIAESYAVCEAMFHLVASGQMKADRKYYDFVNNTFSHEKKCKALICPILHSQSDDLWKEQLSEYWLSEQTLAYWILSNKYEPSPGSGAEQLYQKAIGVIPLPSVVNLVTHLVEKYDGRISEAPVSLRKPLIDALKEFELNLEDAEKMDYGYEISSLVMSLSLSDEKVDSEILDFLKKYVLQNANQEGYFIDLANDSYVVRTGTQSVNRTYEFIKRYARSGQDALPPELYEIFGERLLDKKRLVVELINRHIQELGEAVYNEDSDELIIEKINALNSQFTQDYGVYIDEQFAGFSVEDLEPIFKSRMSGNKVQVVGLKHLVGHERSFDIEIEGFLPEKSIQSIKNLISKTSTIAEWKNCESFLFSFSDEVNLEKFAEAEKCLIDSARDNPTYRPHYLKHREIICAEDRDYALDRIGLLHEVLDSKVPAVVAVRDQLIDLVIVSPNGSAVYERVSNILSDSTTPELVRTLQIFKILHPLESLTSGYDTSSSTGSRVIARHVNTYRDLVQEGKPEQAERVQEVFDALIYSDLLKIAVRTADPSLSDFGVAIADLKSRVAEGAEVEPAQLALLANLHNIVDGGNISINSLSVEQAVQELLKRSHTSSLAELVDSYEKKLLTRLGIEKVEDLAGVIDSERVNSDRRNRELVASGKLTLGEGSLIKGVHTLYLDSYSSHGFRCPELLGVNSTFDGTPNDVDMSLVFPEDATGSMRDTVEASLAKGYGDFMIVIANKGVSESPDGKVDPGKYELVRQNMDRHVGIRSGFGWYDIEAVIVKNEEEISKIKYYIAEKGAYIPIVDRDGEVIFSEEEFDELIQKRNSLSEVNARGLLAIKEPIAASEMIGVLRQSDYLDSLYGSHLTLTSTLADHSLNVARIYEEVDVGDEQRLLGPNAMKLALLLHDIGKTQAVEVENDSNKQHLYTEKIVRRFFKDSGVDLKTASIVTSLVSQDFLGHYFQDMEDLEQTLFLVRSEAKKLGVEPADYLELIRVYFMCDAGSYTSRHGDTNLLDGVFDTSIEGRLDLSEDYKSKLDLLRRGL